MTRYLASAILAALTSFALFWAMQAMVFVGARLLEGERTASIDFVRLRKDTTPEQAKREPPKREKPKQAPPPPQISSSSSKLDPGEGVTEIAARIDPSAAVESAVASAGGSDRDVVPLVRTEPEYPPQLEARGITGWVTVEFTVTKTGTVKDARVVASKPSRIFDQAALKAVRRWKYNPMVKDGAAVERRGVRQSFEFSP